MRNLFTLCFTALISASLFSQPVVSITDINTPVNLANCNDTSIYYLDTVTFYAYVVTDGGLSEVVSSSINGANGTRPFIWVNDTANGGAVALGTGLEIIGANWMTSQATAGITSLIEGELIKLTGVVDMFSGATQFRPLNDNALVIQSGNFPSFTPVPVAVGDLNNSLQVNQVTTGQPYEGLFVEIKNVTVSIVSTFSGGTRVSFTVVDSVGNAIEISDIFLAQKLTTWQTKNPNSPAIMGSFVPPSVGTFFKSIKGVVEHSSNGCAGGTGFGYRIHPFDSTHYEVGKATPSITNVSVSPSVPTSSDPITISADVQDSDGSVDSVNLFWSANPATPVSGFTKVAMTMSGALYTATLPAQPNNTTVRYYIAATDNDTTTSLYPRTLAGQTPNTAAIYVRDNGLSIMDVQKPIPGSNGDSPFEDQRVTVKGFVTAGFKNCDLGYVYIQDSSATEYAGIALRGTLDINDLNRNEYVEVKGQVQESFGFTQLLVDTINRLGSGFEIEPIELSPADSSEINNYEKYESMLLKYAGPLGADLHVTVPNLGNGEYAVSTNPNFINDGNSRRILAGRQNGTFAQSSLYVQLVADARYDTVDKPMFYDPIVTSDTITLKSVTGILWYAFGDFKLTPRNNNDFVGLNVQLDTSGTCAPAVFSTTEVEVRGQVSLYPNPATDHLSIETSADEITVKVYDLKGTLLTSVTNERQGNISLDLSRFKAGLYLVQVSSDSPAVGGTYKVVIAR